MGISPAPGEAPEPKGQVVQGGGQLPGVRGVRQGRAAGKPVPAPGSFLPDMLVARGQSVGAPSDRALGQHTRAVERATTGLVVMQTNQLGKVLF